jgi:hypothetical protein
MANIRNQKVQSRRNRVLASESFDPHVTAIDKSRRVRTREWSNGLAVSRPMPHNIDWDRKEQNKRMVV